MTFWEYILLGWRNKIFIISVTVAITILGFILISAQLASKYSATLFISIAVKDQNTSLNSSTLENLQAADLFTETIQGWFKNPNFMKRIKDSKLEISEITAKKQEKQNLLINFETEQKIESEQAQKVILETLNSELDTYKAKMIINLSPVAYEALGRKSILLLPPNPNKVNLPSLEVPLDTLKDKS